MLTHNPADQGSYVIIHKKKGDRKSNRASLTIESWSQGPQAHGLSEKQKEGVLRWGAAVWWGGSRARRCWAWADTHAMASLQVRVERIGEAREAASLDVDSPRACTTVHD